MGGNTVGHSGKRVQLEKGIPPKCDNSVMEFKATVEKMITDLTQQYAG